MSQTNPRRIVIGDIHGHYEGLQHLLEAIALSTDDEIYFLGDLIDRGPDSAQVVKFVRENQYPCVMGNHEQMLLAAISGGEISEQDLQLWLYSGGDATLESYGTGGIPPEDIEWIANLPGYLDLGNVWLVHAGVNPKLTLVEQGFDEFCWIREAFHSSTKPYFKDKLIVTGHTITFTFPGVSAGQIVQGKGWLGIETGVYHHKSGWLTALDMTNALVYQYNIHRRRFRQLDFDRAAILLKPEVAGDRRSRSRR
ncbi:metallophosphoesterase family protein [Merismopedia glauca]|uniref:Serine/threonine protein phosphatase n=1 Tax=Merismopedia glauca CCAP 1448/3 TaxID=1296344 RepID=A0A2T1C305_9CYAN|nr:metallophosphoesterase family protein [Merismopedia glauca]PSB02527.1 serine/threonine protein phosphatase [Merismopedia glauca CCAP 1448/3]